MAYFEGEIPTVVTGNGSYGNNGMWGSDGIWAILLLALLGNRGFGFGGGFGGGTGYGAGSEFIGYQLGKSATTNDVASGFSTSEIMSDLNSIIVGQANMQNWINQGFYGIDRSLLQGFHGVDNAICTLGYQTQTGFNGVNQTIANCCCDIKSMLMENRYLNEKQTCEIVNAINSGNQRLVDIYTNDKIDTLNRKLSIAETSLNQCQNNAYLINQLRPQPIPAYPVFPTTSFAYPSGVTFGVGGNNGCCGCGSNF